MSDKTGIQWTDATWNPIRGCSRVSEGCRHCYAEAVAARFSGPGLPYEGLTTKGKWNGKIVAVEKHLTDPLRWTAPRRIFVNSMSDLFHEGLTDGQIDHVFAVMAMAERHTFQVLTKRPERMRDYVNSAQAWGERRDSIEVAMYNLGNDDTPRSIHRWPLPNVWLGVSCEDQETANERLPLLFATPAAVRFVSAEPLLGPVELFGLGNFHPSVIPMLNWVIVGGESGPSSRPCAIEWVSSIVEQCSNRHTEHVACFVKQLGACPYHSVPGTTERLRLKDKKGGDISEWPERLRVRQFPRDMLTRTMEPPNAT